MKLTIKLFGLLILLSGISTLIIPEIIFGWLEGQIQNTSLYISAIIVRLVFGILLIVAAKESKYPLGIEFFGYLFIIFAIVFIFMGQESFQDFSASLISDLKPFAAVSGVFDIAIGAFFIYAFTGNKKLEQK